MSLHLQSAAESALAVAKDSNAPPTASMSKSTSLLSNYAVSAVSVSCGVVIISPIDVIKIRQQLAGENSQNIVRTGFSVVQKDGMNALYRGVAPAVARGILYGGTRLGLYAPLKETLSSKKFGEYISPFGLKVIAGMTSGSIAAGLFHPLDLVKTRIQAPGFVPGTRISTVLLDCIRKEGILGLWQGASPSMMRTALLTASQCATYDEVKGIIMKTFGWSDSLKTHFLGSAIAGLVTTSVTAPLDVVKTLMMAKGGVFRGPIHCLQEIWRTQGIRGMFKGWSANWARQGPMTTIIFVISESIRPLLGLESL